MSWTCFGIVASYIEKNIKKFCFYEAYGSIYIMPKV